jgi:DNA-binding response OmpR family regulator
VSTVRVLVVEDDPSVRGLLQTLLEAEGYSVTTASDGLGGLGQAAAASPELVLLDLVMPDLGGARVLERLRDDPVLSQIPVIVVTGHEDALPDVRAQLGDDNVFLKPFAVAELLARVGAVTGGP